MWCLSRFLQGFCGDGMGDVGEEDQASSCYTPQRECALQHCTPMMTGANIYSDSDSTLIQCHCPCTVERQRNAVSRNYVGDAQDCRCWNHEKKYKLQAGGKVHNISSHFALLINGPGSRKRPSAIKMDKNPNHCLSISLCGCYLIYLVPLRFFVPKHLSHWLGSGSSRLLWPGWCCAFLLELCYSRQMENYSYILLCLPDDEKALGNQQVNYSPVTAQTVRLCAHVMVQLHLFSMVSCGMMMVR